MLSEAGVAETHSPAVAIGAGAGYAMGWEVVTVNGTRGLQHDGSVFDSHAQVILIPTAGCGVVVFSTQTVR